MGKRRPGRHPGVKKLSNGKYLIRVQTRKHPRTGRRKEVKKIVECLSVDDAAAARLDLKRRVMAGDAAIRLERKTVKTYARCWFESKALRLADSTAERFAYAMDLHIVPALGDLFIDVVTKQDIEEWVKVEEKRWKATSVNGWLGVLKMMFADASADLNIPDPCRRVAPLAEDFNPDDDPNALTEDELRTLLEAYQELQPQLYPLVLTLVLTGLRWGEATALRWGDLDRNAGIIRIRRAHYRGNVKPVKTKRPRTAPLSGVLLGVLDGWRAELMRQQHPGLQAGWCFPSNKGTPRVSNVMTKPMRACLRAAGISKRVTVQGLRRSAEDVLRRLNVSGPLAEAMMGHNARMRARYSTISDAEIARLGPRIATAVGISPDDVVPSVVPSDAD